MSEEQIELHFPGITNSGYAVRSPATKEYDCVAWAAGDTEAWWWPDPLYVSYWPLEIPREENIEAFVKAFERLGYSCCGEAAPEKTYEKIAIYVDSRRKPTHVARQLKSGRWISKLGEKRI